MTRDEARPRSNTPLKPITAITATTREPLGTFDSSAISRLAFDLESYPRALSFTDAFTLMLNERVAAIHEELTGPPVDDQLTTLLSLRASAVMAGATQLQHTTTQAIAARRTRSYTPDEVEALHQRLLREAQDFTAAYTTFRSHQPRPRRRTR